MAERENDEEEEETTEEEEEEVEEEDGSSRDEVRADSSRCVLDKIATEKYNHTRVNCRKRNAYKRRIENYGRK